MVAHVRSSESSIGRRQLVLVVEGDNNMPREGSVEHTGTRAPRGRLEIKSSADYMFKNNFESWRQVWVFWIVSLAEMSAPNSFVP